MRVFEIKSMWDSAGVRSDRFFAFHDANTMDHVGTDASSVRRSKAPQLSLESQ